MVYTWHTLQTLGLCQNSTVPSFPLAQFEYHTAWQSMHEPGYICHVLRSCHIVAGFGLPDVIYDQHATLATARWNIDHITTAQSTRCA